MSSIKKHFPHFGSHNCNQPAKHGPDASSCKSTICHSHSHHHPPPTTGFACSPAHDSLHSQHMDAVSFKADVLSCLDLCSSYIQALNNLCSAGAVLAQNLTQVFSRDVVSTSPGLLPPPAAKTESRRRLLGLRSGLVRQCQTAPHPAAESDSDSLYYDMTEQFLRVWEMMSVSTAGASATIKTETLMTLQEVINQLESADPYGDGPQEETGDGGPDLGKSIESAKSCLLAYIELQAQFSHNSWKSLNHLSKALKSDASLTDVVKNIKQHFDFSTKSAVADACSSRSEDQSQDPGPQDPKNKTSSAANVSGLKEAMDLLSLDGSRRSKRRRKAKSFNKNERRDTSSTYGRDKSCEKENILNRKAKPSATRLSYLGDKCFSSSQVESVDTGLENGIKSQSTSTWPGKVATNAVGPSDRNEKSSHKNQESWSLWSSQTPAFADSCPTASSPWRDSAQFAYWNVFPAHSSQSLSASNLRAATAALSASTISGSGASSNNSIGVPSTTSSSVATNRSYDLFAPMQKNPVSYFNGTHSLNTHVPNILSNNNVNNNNNDLSFGGFCSLNDILHLERTTSPTTTTGKRFDSGDPSFNSPALPRLSRSPLMSPDNDPLQICSPTTPATLLPDSVRSKTSTWPLKQESGTGPQLLNNAPSSTLTNSNWFGLCSAPYNYSPGTDRHFDNGSFDRQDITQSLWSFDGAEKVSALSNPLHQQQLHNQHLQQVPIEKADVTRFTLFETNNNCALSDKNF